MNISRILPPTLMATIVAIALIAPSPALAGLDAAEATPTSVTLAWTAPGDDGDNGTATEYDLRYALSPVTDGSWNSATQVSGEPIPSPAGTVESMDVTGLQPNTTYYFAIKASDEVPNWSPLSNVVTKTTLPEDTPPANVTNLFASSATATSLTLTWTAPGDDGTSGTAAGYDIRYATSTITGANWSSATQATGEPSPSVAGSSESFVVTGLTAGTTYYFALVTADEVPNLSGLSNIASGSTSDETTPPSNIANLGVGSPTEHSVALSWSAPGDDGMSGTASEYDVRYSLAYITALNWDAATQVASVQDPGPAGSLETLTISGLSSGTTYFFAIKTCDEIPNWSGISNVVTISTSQDATPPLAVSSLNAVLPELTGMTLVWLASGDDGATGTATSYDIRYSTSPINNVNWSSATQVGGEPVPQPAGTPESLMVAGLSENTTYYFAMKVADERNNWSAISNIASNSTSQDDSPPSAINDLAAVEGENNGEIALTWTATGDDGLLGRATGYEIRYSESNINNGNWSSALPWGTPPFPEAPGSEQNLLLTDLVPGQRYYIGIKVYDDAANASALSNVVNCEAKFEFILANGNLGQPSSPPHLSVLPTARPILVVENADPSPQNVYRFELATDSNFFGLVAGGVVDQEAGTATSWQVDVPLAAEQYYYWRVATNADGYSDTYAFSVEPSSHAYPNPVYFSKHDAATFTDLPQTGQLLLTSVSGTIVREWTNLTGDDVRWDGTNESGQRVASGAYLWYLPDTGASGKLLVIN